MSHGGMTLAQAQELQRRHGGRILKLGVDGNPRYNHYPSTDKGLLSETAISEFQKEYQMSLKEFEEW